MYYIKKKIEKKELIKVKKNNLYLNITDKLIIFNYNNINLILSYYNSNIAVIRQYFKEVGII